MLGPRSLDIISPPQSPLGVLWPPRSIPHALGPPALGRLGQCAARGLPSPGSARANRPTGRVDRMTQISAPGPAGELGPASGMRRAGGTALRGTTRGCALHPHGEGQGMDGGAGGQGISRSMAAHAPALQSESGPVRSTRPSASTASSLVPRPAPNRRLRRGIATAHAALAPPRPTPTLATPTRTWPPLDPAPAAAAASAASPPAPTSARPVNAYPSASGGGGRASESNGPISNAAAAAGPARAPSPGGSGG